VGGGELPPQSLLGLEYTPAENVPTEYQLMENGDCLIPRMRELYEEMDEAYRSISELAGFSCEACDGTRCCTVDVNLHTLAEMLYLRRGFNTLEVSIQLAIIGRCRSMIKAKEDDPFGDAYRDAVCALNFDGRCVLYEYRPMICRLAGIRHHISRPDGRVVESCGCAKFEQDVLGGFSSTDERRHRLRIDRTDYYRKMAALEMEVVRSRGRRTPSCTISETLGLDQLDYE
jgi:hypothetical protein